MKKSVNKYLTSDLSLNEEAYNDNKIKKINAINQISFDIKETMIYEKEFSLKNNILEIYTIHPLIYILKILKLKYDTNQIFEMFPYITFSKSKQICFQVIKIMKN